MTALGMHLGDCIVGMRELPDDSVDVVITDPPYEAEAHEKGKRQGPTSDGRKRVVDESFIFPPITEHDRSAAAEHFARVARVGAVVFCQVEAVEAWKKAVERAGLVYRRTIPWVKPDAMPSLHGRWPGQAFEAIVLALHRGKTVPIGGAARYYECTRERGEMRAHPTAKPLALMLDIVVDFTNPGELILDAFAGSGTTGIACKQLGRRFIGFERDPAYYKIACRRIAGEAAKPHETQLDLLGGVR